VVDEAEHHPAAGPEPGGRDSQPPRSPGKAPSRFSRRVLRALLIAVVALTALALVSRAGEILLLLFAGTLFAIFLNGIARWLAEKLHLAYWLSLTLTVATLFAAATGLGWWLGPRLARQTATLLGQVPATAQAVIGADRLKGWIQGLSKGGTESVLHNLETALTTARGVLTVTIKFLGGLAIFLFLGIYGAAQPGVYRRAVVRLVPVPGRKRADEVITAIVVSLHRWLFGRVLAMIFVGAATSLVFWLLGIPVALALGLLAGLLAFIEYIGAIVSALPALAMAANHGGPTVIWVLILFTGVHAVEGYVLTPLLARRTVQFPPGFTLSVQLLFGVFFGLLGVTLATPATVVFTLLIRMLYVEDALGDRPH
jgi:predicted PurR-regulated permease PerM